MYMLTIDIFKKCDPFRNYPVSTYAAAMTIKAIHDSQINQVALEDEISKKLRLDLNRVASSRRILRETPKDSTYSKQDQDCAEKKIIKATILIKKILPKLPRTIAELQKYDAKTLSALYL